MGCLHDGRGIEQKQYPLSAGKTPLDRPSLARDQIAAVTLAEVFLNELRAEMYIQLDERSLNAAEAVNLPGLDHQNIARTGLELLAVHHVQGAAGLNELDFIVRVTVRSRSAPRPAVEQEGRNADRALAGTTSAGATL